MTADSGRVINGGMGEIWPVVYRARNEFDPFVGRRDVAVYENGSGAVRSLKPRARQWPWLFEKHARGAQRLGIAPTLGNGRCRFGVLDLDAHDPTTPARHPNGLALVGLLDRHGIVAYLENSRGGRGVHVWLFFEAPGVPARDLHPFLEALAGELRRRGPVDIFPNSAIGKGGVVLLPYFGGVVNLLDVDLKPIPRDKLEANPVNVIPRASRPGWPPRHWNFRPASNGNAAAFQAQVSRLRADGLVFERFGVLHARKGARNAIAGAVARDIVRRGGTLEDFKSWDASNEPPLACDEPEALPRWWKWAQRRERRPHASPRARVEAACRDATAR